jgi:hypothetical protein
VELTDYETQCLLKAFVHGKKEVLEEDALTLVRWAMAQRMGAMVLEMVLDGELTPIVEGTEVKVTIRKAGGEAA